MAASYPDNFTLVDLPEIKNQGAVGSCVAHTASEIIEYFNGKETGNQEKMSTDFIYGMQGIAFNRLESGMFLRDACKIIKEYGDCLKTSVSTNIEQPQCTNELKAKLTNDIYKEALNYQVKSYARCANDNAIKHALMNYGPVMASTKWYDRYNIKKNIITFDTTTNYGYHAIMIYGWTSQGWLCQNSWGKKWNGNGRFILPFGQVCEAWSFVDNINSDIKQPKRNSFLDIIYRLLNTFINFIKGR
jgi:C1A family cysteine protease